MSINAVGNFREACRRIGLDANKTNLTQYAITKYNIKTRHPERLGIADLYALKNKEKGLSKVELARTAHDKPLTYMINDIIG